MMPHGPFFTHQETRVIQRNKKSQIDSQSRPSMRQLTLFFLLFLWSMLLIRLLERYQQLGSPSLPVCVCSVRQRKLSLFFLSLFFLPFFSRFVLLIFNGVCFISWRFFCCRRILLRVFLGLPPSFGWTIARWKKISKKILIREENDTVHCTI